MIRGLILYYLNIKETHGYEIQRFIQISGMDRWTKIQSGSIYYALAKLEKEGNISIVAEKGTSQRARKIYAITDKGRKTLHDEMAQELQEPIVSIGSMKFITDPMLSTLEEREIRSIVTKHIEGLKEQMEYWKEWKAAKTDSEKVTLIDLSFDMSIRSLEDQILWHEELLKNLKTYIGESKSIERFIHSFDADRIEPVDDISETINQLDFAKKLKETILSNPELAIQDLDRIIEELKTKKQ